MDIREIKAGTELAFFKEVNMRASGSAFDAQFKNVEWDRLFTVHSKMLYDDFDSLVDDIQFIIAFEASTMVFTFAGRLKEKKRIPHLVVVEQTGHIKSHNRRKRGREELVLAVEIFDLPSEKMKSGEFSSLYIDPILSDRTYDISTAGMCVITNTLLKSEHDPYYLVRLLVTDRDTFLLPARLVRKVEKRRTGLGNYVYGFEFIYDDMPGMENNLTEAIVRKKLMS